MTVYKPTMQIVIWQHRKTVAESEAIRKGGEYGSIIRRKML